MPARPRRVLPTALLALAVLAGLVPAASAVQTRQSAVVAAVPRAATPSVLDGTVNAFAQVGTLVVAGGSFTRVTDETTGATSARSSVVAFDAVTGRVSTTFRPTFASADRNAYVTSVLPGPTAGTVYVGGRFTTVNGAAAVGLVLLRVSDGSRVTSFAPVLAGGVPAVNALRLVGSRLFVGGTFTTVGKVAHAGLATVNASTGAVDPYLSSNVSVNHNWTTSSPSTDARAAVGVTDLDVTPAGDRLVAIGNFKKVDGTLHDQIALWDLGSTRAALRDWRTTRFEDPCLRHAYDSYVRDVDVSPDGAYFVVATTGGYRAGSLCDAAARFETAGRGQAVQPTWVAYSGGDSLLATAVTGAAVYVGGHQRWLNNPHGRDRAMGGGVPRPGVAALDPVTGLPLAWNPGRHPRGVGTRALYATSTGLWMGSDTETIGVGATRTTRRRIAFFPLTGGAAPVVPAAQALPGGVYLGAVPAAPATGVLHRINVGGPRLRSIDAGPDWAADDAATPSPYRVNGTTLTPYGTPVPALDRLQPPPAGTPSAVFSTERSDSGAPTDPLSAELTYRLPVPAGTAVELRLAFASRCTCVTAAGQRVFDVLVDGVVRSDDLDVRGSAGDGAGTVRRYAVTSDGTLDVVLRHQVGTPTLSAVEVVPAGSGAYPVTGSSLVGRTFDGATAGPAVRAASPLDPSTVRGATMVGNRLLYGRTDGNLYTRTVSGRSWGPEVAVDPYDDPAWSGVDTGSTTSTGAIIRYRGAKPSFYDDLVNVTSMAYDPVTRRLYYTLYRQTGLYYRLFSPDSGALSQEPQTVAGVALPADLTGAFLAGGSLYWATSSGSLSRAGFDGTRLTTAATVVSTRASGVDWSSRVLYLGPAPAANALPVASATVTCVDLRCTADGRASADRDGALVSYAWTWGDGATSSGPTATHDYAAGGSVPVTLTVTDEDGATATSSVTATPAPHVNEAPVAAVRASCDLTTCVLDGSGSSDADGRVESWSWAFSDGGAGTGSTVTHAFPAGATSATATLTVVDDTGAATSTTHELALTPRPASPIAFRGVATTSSSTATALQVPVPAAAEPGDALLLKVSTSGTATAPQAPEGWEEVTRLTAGSALTVVWQRVATADDAADGVAVPVQLATSVKSLASVVAYSGTAATSPVRAAAAAADLAAGAAQHVAPPVAAEIPGSWVVWSWTDKSSSTTAWTPPADVVTREARYQTGTGYLTQLLADEGAARPAMTVPSRTATTDAASTGGMISLVLAPAG